MMIAKIARKILRLFRPVPPPKIVKAQIKLTEPGQSLIGRNIIVTGGTRGLGKAIAEKCISEGAKVLITGRDEIKTKEIASSIGAEFLILNLQQPENFSQFVSNAVQKLGSIDCLVNNAGISLHESTFFEVTPETFGSQFLTNLSGPFFLTQEVVKFMQNNEIKGNILFISSETGFTVDIRPYGLLKTALNSLVQGLAYMLCKEGIRVNAIAPGVVATDMTGFRETENLEYPYNSIGRLYIPEEMAQVAVFLLSDSSFPISGQIIGCNNARTINARGK